MAQNDILLVQNTHATLTEFTERYITMAKGVLLTANASAVPTALAAGTNGYMLIRDDAEATGLKWVAVSAGHTQNTDTGTTNNDFTVDSDSTTGKLIMKAGLGAANLTMTLTNAALTSTSKTITLPDATGTVSLTSDKLSAHAATTSAELAGVISDETGSGKLVFGTSPTISTSIVTDSASLDVFDTTATTANVLGAATTLNLGYDGTAASTTNINTGTTANATTKTINIGTGGGAGSTTNINLGSASGGTVTVNKDLVVTGDLTINGTTTTINATTITVDDKNIELGSVASPTDTTADGGGITLKGTTDKTIIWDNANDNWTLNQNVNIPTGFTYKINNTSVLSNTAVLGLTLSPQAVGFTIAGGTTSKTLTVGLDASVSGTNTGDQDLSGLVPKTLYDANTILFATSDNTPAALLGVELPPKIWAAVPADKVGTGYSGTAIAGQMARDANFIYICDQGGAAGSQKWSRSAKATNW